MNATNRQRAMLKSLRSRKGRDETGLFLVEGMRLCEELADSGLKIEMLLVSYDERPKVAALIRRFETAGVVTFDARPGEIEQISDTVTSQGILAAARWKDVKLGNLKLAQRSRIVALDAVADPGNVGTVIRCADWFGADAVILGAGCADLLNPKTVRATMGGLFHLPVVREAQLPETLADLKTAGFKIAAGVMNGSPNWQEWAKPQRSVLLLGSEAHGLSAELMPLADMRVTIPRRGRAESLNVAIAAGIFLSAT